MLTEHWVDSMIFTSRLLFATTSPALCCYLLILQRIYSTLPAGPSHLLHQVLLGVPDILRQNTEYLDCAALLTHRDLNHNIYLVCLDKIDKT